MITVIMPAPVMVLFAVSTDLKPVKLEMEAAGIANLHDLFARLAQDYPKFKVLSHPSGYNRLHNVVLLINSQVVQIKDPRRFREVPMKDGDALQILIPYEGG